MKPKCVANLRKRRKSRQSYNVETHSGASTRSEPLVLMRQLKITHHTHIMNINITDQYNQKHTFSFFPTDGQITVKELYESCLKTAEDEGVEKDSIGFLILLSAMGAFIKQKLPTIHESWTFYSERIGKFD